MKLISTNFPPPWQDRACQKSWDQFLENQRLDIFRRIKILLSFSKYIGQIGQRSYQVSATACGSSSTKNTCGLPDMFDSNYGFTGKVMLADKKRIVEKQLSAWRFIVCIVQ